MESITHEPEMVKGLEVLNFGQVELEKAKVDGSNTFATQGTLNVLYFDYYDKFILQLDNWRYALIPRLYATALDNELESFSYQLPAYDGTYTLRLNSIQSHFALENFETILQNTTKFSREMPQENLSRQGQGPEVGAAQGAVIEQTHISMVESRTVPMGAIGGSANPPVTEIRESSIERTQVMPRSSHPGVQGEPRRHYERTGQVVNLGNPSYNYSPKKSNRKRDKMKLKLKKMMGKKEQNNELWNPNFSFNRDFESIKRTNEAMVPVQEFKREEVKKKN